MDKDRVKGAAQQVKGKVKDWVGQAAGDTKLQGEGKADKAEGKIRNCLFSTVEWDARAVLRGGGTDRELEQLMRDCVWAKKPGHGIDTADFVRPQRAMYEIGG